MALRRHTVHALAVQQLAVRHTATVLIAASAARCAAEIKHKQGSVTPETIDAAIERFDALLRSALASVTGGKPR